MSHKYRAAIGRESPRPASRRFTRQLEPRRVAAICPSSRKSDFCGKNSGFAARREMPAFLYSRQGISSPRMPKAFRSTSCAPTKGLAAWHQAKGRCRLIGRHTCTANLAARPKPAPYSRGCPRPCTLARAPKVQKRPVPRRQTGCALRHPDAAESVERNPFLPMRPACANRLSPLTPAAVHSRRWPPVLAATAAGCPCGAPPPPNRLSKSPFLLMQPACASRLSP